MQGSHHKTFLALDYPHINRMKYDNLKDEMGHPKKHISRYYLLKDARPIDFPSFRLVSFCNGVVRYDPLVFLDCNYRKTANRASKFSLRDYFLTFPAPQ
jgi:hypothetical protein